LRRATARQETKQWEECLRDLEAANKLEPSSELQGKIKQVKLEVKKEKRKDYYAILGVSKDANESELKKAYRKQALLWHPDKHTESEEKAKIAEAKFKDITEAYEILNDDQKRRRYDSGVDLQDDDGMGMGGMNNVDVNQIFSMFMGGGGMGGMPPGMGMRMGGRPGGMQFHFG
jgi:DnaJ family protein C protein 7